MKTIKKLAVTCGGTGGHFYPGLSLARTVRNQGGEAVLLLGGKNSVQQAEIAARYGMKAIVLPYMPPPSWRSPGSCWRFLKGALTGKRQARQFLREFQPDALLGMGSFASLPAVWGALNAMVPVFLHDGNARIGRANRLFSRYARALGTAFPAVNGARCHCPVVCTGMPLRPELAEQRLEKAAAMRELNARYGGNLEENRFTVLIFGGSQGARKLNQAFAAAVRELNACGGNLQVIHLTGKGEFDAMKQFWGDAGAPGLILPSLAEMGWAYSAADVAVARSGGSSVAELRAFGKYAVVIPYPYASELHQNDNAEFLVRQGGAEMVPDELVTPQLAREILERLRRDPAKLAETGRGAAGEDAWDGCRQTLALIAETLEP